MTVNIFKILQKNSFSNKCSSFEYFISQIIQGKEVVLSCWNCSQQVWLYYIKDHEALKTGKFSFAITGIKYIFEHIKMEKQYFEFDISQYYSFTVFLVK